MMLNSVVLLLVGLSWSRTTSAFTAPNILKAVKLPDGLPEQLPSISTPSLPPLPSPPSLPPLPPLPSLPAVGDLQLPSVEALGESAGEEEEKEKPQPPQPPHPQPQPQEQPHVAEVKAEPVDEQKEESHHVDEEMDRLRNTMMASTTTFSLLNSMDGGAPFLSASTDKFMSQVVRS